MNMKPCKNFANYKAIRMPKCNCWPCWQLYFRKYPAYVAAMLSVYEEGGEQNLIRLHGDKPVKMFKHFIELHQLTTRRPA